MLLNPQMLSYYLQQNIAIEISLVSTLQLLFSLLAMLLLEEN